MLPLCPMCIGATPYPSPSHVLSQIPSLLLIVPTLFSTLLILKTTEAEGRRETTHHGALPSLAGGEGWTGGAMVVL
jgi:hypothetical protein